jgi:molybdopterin-guanine dinucleotide biosynthesis protein A
VETKSQHAHAARPGDPPLTGLVLCGGQSRRMGRDKAALAMGGQTLLERCSSVLAQCSQEVLLACGPTPRYLEAGRRVVLDAVADGGPLAGLLAGLEAARHDWVACLACDMPLVPPPLYSALLRHALGAGLDACLLRTSAGLEPLCAVYHKSCAPAVRAALLAGERRMTAFHSGWGPRRLAIGWLDSGLFSFDPGALALNLNTPADYESQLLRKAPAGKEQE